MPIGIETARRFTAPVIGAARAAVVMAPLLSALGLEVGADP